MKRLIINADDFGLTHGVCQGIISAATNGVVTSTTAMMCAPQSVALLKEYLPQLPIPCGVHLQLTGGSPLTPTLKTLCEIRGGKFPRKKEDAIFPPELVKAEWLAQIHAFQKAGGTPSHLDTHHSMHKVAAYAPVYLEIAAELGLPVRGGVRDNGAFAKAAQGATVTMAQHVEGTWSTTGQDEAAVINILRQVFQTADTAELVTHPGFVDADLAPISSLTTLREHEHRVLTSTTFRTTLDAEGIQRISYRDL